MASFLIHRMCVQSSQNRLLKSHAFTKNEFSKMCSVLNEITQQNFPLTSLFFLLHGLPHYFYTVLNRLLYVTYFCFVSMFLFLSIKGSFLRLQTVVRYSCFYRNELNIQKSIRTTKETNEISVA